MNIFKGQRDQLLRPLQSVSGIVEKRHTLPILSNVLLESTGGRLTLLATDIELQITTTTNTEDNSEAAITIGAKKLQDILKSLPDSSVVSLDLEGSKLLLKSGKSRFTLQTLPAQDFPKIVSPSCADTVLELPQQKLKALINRVQYAMAQQDIRYYLNGLLFVINGDQLRLIATDGHRLAYAVEQLDKDYGRSEIIVPRKTVTELSKQLSDSEDPIKIGIAQNQATFTFLDIEMVTKLIDGKFPDYERVIPSSHTKRFTLTKTEYQQALQRVAILTTDKFRGVRLLLDKCSLKIVSTNSDQEEAIEEIEIAYDGEFLDVGFNVTYLLDVLNHTSSDEIEVYLSDANSSALFLLPGVDTFKYVVMPMRI